MFGRLFGKDVNKEGNELLVGRSGRIDGDGDIIIYLYKVRDKLYEEMIDM